jgi:hypothetical protein
VSITTVVHDPANAGIGIAILIIGAFIYRLWPGRAGSSPALTGDDSFPTARR